MFQRGAGSLAVVLEEQDVAQPPVVLQVVDAVTESPENLFDRFFAELGQAQRVLRGLDEDFVRTDSLHLVEQPFAFAFELAFNAEDGELVGYDSQRPAALIGAAAVAIGKNLRGRLPFVARTKGTETAGSFRRYGL